MILIIRMWEVAALSMDIVGIQTYSVLSPMDVSLVVQAVAPPR